MLDLVERRARQPGLARALLANAPPKNMRANAADLASLLAAGELDYIYEYQSVAEANGFRFVRLPPEVDLGDASRAADYAMARVKVRGTRPGTVTEYIGQPILYGLSIPSAAPHPAAARRFLTLLFSPESVAALRASHVDMLDAPIVVGRGAPPEINVAARPATAER
jgi:molybdate/tungstate transport system substrate-binding protein